jgi:hypothetical protein
MGSDYAKGKQIKISTLYNMLRIAYNQGVTGVLDTLRVFVPYSEQDEGEIQYLMWENTEFRKLVNWVNKKITLEIGKADYRTIDVRLRIATGMLNNLNLPKNLNVKIHRQLVFNVRKELGLLNTEDLPF